MLSPPRVRRYASDGYGDQYPRERYSSEGPPPDSVEQAAATVIALLDAMGIAKAALIGHSFGSLIALQAAAQAPDRPWRDTARRRRNPRPARAVLR